MKTKTCFKCKIEKPITKFYKRRTRKDGTITYHNLCIQCCKSKNHEYYSLNKSDSLARYHTRRNRARDFVKGYLKTHPCVDCGEADIVVLEFDHVKQKNSSRHTLNALVHSGYPIERLKKEISKCEVRCANCHRRKHNGKYY